MDVKPKKYLGQHFLIDEEISQRISEAILKSKKIKLLEIGPGTGALTKYLLHENIDLISYELDTESITYLKNAYPTLKVHNEDILKVFDLENSVKSKKSYGGTSFENVKKMIKKYKKETK